MIRDYDYLEAVLEGIQRKLAECSRSVEKASLAIEKEKFRFTQIAPSQKESQNQKTHSS